MGKLRISQIQFSASHIANLNANNLEQNFKKASKFIDFGDNESAKQIYLDILEKYPMNVKASQCLNELNKSSFKSKTNIRDTIINDIYRLYKNKNFK